MSKIKKAVFPVAGLGTRFLPATKASPKEMLPVVDKPLIQYAAEEAVAAGIETLIFVTGRNKQSIPDHFDKAYELEAELLAQGKSEMLAVSQQVLPANVACAYVRQPRALGLGHAVMCAAPLVGNEPFAVVLADDLIDGGSTGVLQQMVAEFETHGCALLGTEELPWELVGRYGIVETGDVVSDRVSTVRRIVEKPTPDEAPSNLGVVGRYLLTPEIFTVLEHTPAGAGGEIQLTDAIAELMQQQAVMAYRFAGKRFDCGSKLGYLRATVEFGLQHDELGRDFRAYLRELDLD